LFQWDREWLLLPASELAGKNYQPLVPLAPTLRLGASNMTPLALELAPLASIVRQEAAGERQQAGKPAFGA
jgi:hypothetical protein